MRVLLVVALLATLCSAAIQPSPPPPPPGVPPPSNPDVPATPPPPPAVTPAPTAAPTPAPTAAPTPAPTPAPTVQPKKYITPVYDCPSSRRASSPCCSSANEHETSCCRPRSSCSQNGVTIVPAGTLPSSCSDSIRASTCCRSPQQSCCSRKCYSEPEIKPEECSFRIKTVCCSFPKQTCCNPCSNGALVEISAELEAQLSVESVLKHEIENAIQEQIQAEATTETAVSTTADAEAQLETEECPELVRAVTCCPNKQPTKCCNPQKPCQDTKVGDMQMGRLQPTCPHSSENRCCKPTEDTCCKKCHRHLVDVDVVESCPTPKPCCTSVVSKCCNECGNFAELAASAEVTPVGTSENGKPLIPAVVAGSCDDIKRQSTCCSAADEHKTSCCTPQATCKSQSKIGDMQMGKLCDQAHAANSCCQSAHDDCCNKAKSGCPSF